ncbi:MAG TPA: diguanylate cyclase [Gammaproteobacteria bacterium]|nr:diguanylate cyclase [Gammaproteobacteria bacterium]
MAEAAADAKWKDRYRELVRDLEDKERHWAALETALRSAAGKLALAAMGQGKALDAALEQVVGALRSDISPPKLDATVSQLVRALQLDEIESTNSTPTGAAPPAVVPRQPAAGEARESPVGLEETLGAFLAAIERVPALSLVATAVQRELGPDTTPAEAAALLERIANAVADVIASLQSQRAELESFLDQVTRQLAFLERWTGWQLDAAQSRRDDNIGLERTFEHEMTGLKRDVDEIQDVATIKVKVQSRLDAVADQLRTFRESEERRAEENERHAAELKREVAQLKTRTNELAEICAAQENRLMIDSLTGVHSRYAYEARINEEHQRWQRHGQPLTYTIWDIDHFKRINDQYGHEAGDRLLRAVAEILNRSKRAEDFLARIGGEEFVLLLPMTGLDAGLVVANKLRAAIEETAFRHKRQPERITISCGLTEFRPGDTPVAVYARADEALYKAKEQGRNRCVPV